MNMLIHCYKIKFDVSVFCNININVKIGVLYNIYKCLK